MGAVGVGVEVEVGVGVVADWQCKGRYQQSKFRYSNTTSWHFPNTHPPCLSRYMESQQERVQPRYSRYTQLPTNKNH